MNPNGSVNSIWLSYSKHPVLPCLLAAVEDSGEHAATTYRVKESQKVTLCVSLSAQTAYNPEVITALEKLIVA